MSLDSGEITSQDLSPNAGILGTQIADKTIEARNLADGVIPTSAITDGDDIFIINDVLTASFSITPATTGTSTVTITHNLGYVPLVQAFVDITNNQWSAGQIGTFGLPYFLLGTQTVGGVSIFTMLAVVKVQKLNISTITFEVGTQGPSQNLAGTITCYFLQETAAQS